MRFNRGARLDTSQVEDRRGRGIGAGGIGGGLGVVGLLIALLLGGNPLDGGGGGGSTGFQTQAPANSDLSAECRTGQDANEQDDCRLVAVVNSVQEYWGRTVDGYQPARTTIFTSGVNTGCGQASSDVGPFYCPADQGVYLDLRFFQELQTKFGARGGPFAEAYILGHEYGHHVQNLLGDMEQVGDDRQGAESGAVRLELQADCYAGAWANGAEQTGFVSDISEQDILDGLDAAAAIGDDRLQERFQGDIDPHQWTHGSSEQRQRWFKVGYRSGDPADCDTFAADEL